MTEQKQYRMADEFKLPVHTPLGCSILRDQRGYYIDGRKSRRAALAHAINSHDAMQDEIAQLKQVVEIQHSLMVTAEKRGVDKSKEEIAQQAARIKELMECLR